MLMDRVDMENKRGTIQLDDAFIVQENPDER
jgi:hypothetical protein